MLLVETLNLITSVFWPEFSSKETLDKFIIPAINIAVEEDSVSHVGYQFVNKLVIDVCRIKTN